MSRNNLIQIYNNTKVIAEKYPKPEKSIKISYNRLNIDWSKIKQNNAPSIKIFNDDTLIIANELYQKTKTDILVLNLASPYRPGGGVETGAMAQEEELFRRSNYYQSLTQQYYPIKDYERIYTKNVTILKNDYYQQISPYQCSFLAIAAIRKPLLDNNKYRNIDRELMKKKIEMIFLAAIYYNYRNIVLGALGCGAYDNPPEEVAEIFVTFIDKYKIYFDNIYFAIKSVRDNNYNIFVSYIKQT